MANDLRLTRDQLFELKKQARIELARRYAKEKDILRWGKIVFPEKFPLPFCRPLHSYMVDVRKADFVGTEAPRNHAKTTIKCFLIPIFQALEEPDEFLHYLNVQSTLEKALPINRGIRFELETNEILHAIYGEQIGQRWTDQQFVLKNGVVFSAVGAGQSIRGINYNNVRPDYMICDDLYDDEDINNPDSTQKKNDWFWSALFPARARSRKCSIHVQGTAINSDDLLEQLKKHDDVEFRTFKAITDWVKRTVLWPELNSFESLEKDRKKQGSIIFFREMQNERKDDAGSIIKSNWILEYDPDKLRFNDDFILENVFLCCDPSIGQKFESDFTGIALVFQARYKDSQSPIYFIVNVWNEKISLHERVWKLDAIGKASSHAVTQCRIEGIGGFKDFVEEVRRLTVLPVVEVNKVLDKISNLESKSHFFENKKVFINKNMAVEKKDLIQYQLTNNHPRHDDVRDAILLSMDNASAGVGVSVFSLGDDENT